MRFLRLGQGFEPVGDFIKPFFPSGFCHTRIHVRVFVSFARNCRFKIKRRGTNGLASRRVAGLFQEFQMSVHDPGFPF